jgi:hypothetical protein
MTYSRSFLYKYRRFLDQKVSMYEAAAKDWVQGYKIRSHGVLRTQWYELASQLNYVSLNGRSDEVF